MNTPEIDCHDLIQQNIGRIGDLPFQFGDQHNWNMGVFTPQPVQAMETAAGSQHQNLWPERSSSSMVSRFDSPASAFYATEKYLGLPHYECQAGPGSGSTPSLWPPHQYSSVGSYFVDSGDQTAHDFELRRTSQSILQPHLCGNQPQYHKSFDSSYKDLWNSSSGNKFHHYDQKPMIGNDVVPGVGHFSAPFERNQDHRVGSNPYRCAPFIQPVFSAQQEKHSPRFSFGIVSASPANHASSGSALANKTRIRWTQDLHERFVECINRLGGPEKATPKAILKLMDSEGLTIFHVKSHLQKYRIAKYLPDSSQGKAEKRTSISAFSQIDEKTGMQIKEALQIQLDVQKHLHDQLEVQRTLQLRIEEQGRQLKKMFDKQQRTTSNFRNSYDSDITSAEEPTFSFEDIDICIAEGSNNTNNNSLFPSKIS